MRDGYRKLGESFPIFIVLETVQIDKLALDDSGSYEEVQNFNISLRTDSLCEEETTNWSVALSIGDF